MNDPHTAIRAALSPIEDATHKTIDGLSQLVFDRDIGSNRIKRLASAIDHLNAAWIDVREAMNESDPAFRFVRKAARRAKLHPDGGVILDSR